MSKCGGERNYGLYEDISYNVDNLGRDAEPKTSNAGNPCVRLSVRVGSGGAAQWVRVLAFNAITVREGFATAVPLRWSIQAVAVSVPSQ
jgi:hypothetical protein